MPFPIAVEDGKIVIPTNRGSARNVFPREERGAHLQLHVSYSHVSCKQEENSDILQASIDFDTWSHTCLNLARYVAPLISQLEQAE